MGTIDSARGTDHPDVYAIDFGSDPALAIHGPRGPVKPRIRGGSQATRFSRELGCWLRRGNVVVESATIGSSGVEPEEIAEIVERSRRFTLYTVSGRAVKNYKKDHGLETDKTNHAKDAEIIYTIATEKPARLKVWRLNEERLDRCHKSVRPHDKRGYQGHEPDHWMSRFPPFCELSPSLQMLLGDKGGKDYLPARAMPFAMAMEEKGSETRSGYERIIGLYDHGYPSFYRRKTIELMQHVAKESFNVNTFDKITPQQRKHAWRVTRRLIRQLWHILHEQGTAHPTKGTCDPVMKKVVAQ